MTTATRALVVVAVMTAVAHAQGPDAEALFREAKKLMKQHAFAAACEKFDASEHLEPAPGTELNLADCREKTGQTASAWAMFVKAAQTAKRSGDWKREAEARRRAAALEPRLVYLTIAVGKRARVAGLVVRRNDIVVDVGQYDQPVPVDPGDYAVTAEAPGHDSWQDAISLGRTNKTVEVPQLDLAIAAAPPPRPVESPPVRAAETASVWTARRKAAVVLGALGVAAVGTGIGFGVRANHFESQSDAICQTSRCNNPDATDLNSKARRDGLIANIGMIGGGTVLVGAIAVWIAGGAKPHGGISIVPSVGPAGISFGGTY